MTLPANPQQGIRAIPETILGTDAADMLHDYATQVRDAANAAPDGIFQKTYGIDDALRTADDLDNAATKYRLYNKIGPKSSNDWQAIALLVGRAYVQLANLDAQVKVFAAADAGFIKDIKDNAKIAAGGIGIAAVIALVIAGFIFLGPMLVKRG